MVNFLTYKVNREIYNNNQNVCSFILNNIYIQHFLLRPTDNEIITIFIRYLLLSTFLVEYPGARKLAKDPLVVFITL